jgi:endonuclease/exonuclease/phosphatase family metal-dependent hydrolase
VAAAPAAADAEQERLDVVAYNVLAPIWAGPEWYPDDLDPAVLDAAARRTAVAAYLTSVRGTAEVVCLQEVQASELPTYAAALGDGFEGILARNDPSFWADWLTDLPWQPNGTAVFVRTDAVSVGPEGFEDLPLAGTGNHAAVATGVHLATGQRLRIASVHLDSDSQVNRIREVESLLAAQPAASGTTDIVCGDVNEGTTIGALKGRFARAGFVDVLAADGVEDPTHPFRDSYNRSPRWGVIDHILVRGGVPVDGRVVDGGVWAIDANTARIEEAMRLLGSDHFPIEGTIAIA